MMTKDESPPLLSRRAKPLGFPWIQVLFVAGVLAGFATLLGLGWWASSLAKDISALAAQREELQESKQDLIKQVAKLRSTAKQSEEKLAVLGQQAAALEDKRDSARATVEALEARMTERGLSTPEVRQYFDELRQTLEASDAEPAPEKPQGRLLMIPFERLDEIRERHPAATEYLSEAVRGTRAARDWAWSDLKKLQGAVDWTVEEQLSAIATIKHTAVDLLMNTKRDSKEFVDAHNLRGQARALEARLLRGEEQVAAYQGALKDLEVAMLGTSFTRPHQDALQAAHALMKLGSSRFKSKSDVVDYACSTEFVRDDKYRSTNCASELMEIAVDLHTSGDEESARALACQAESMTFVEVAIKPEAATRSKHHRAEACQGRW